MKHSIVIAILVLLPAQIGQVYSTDNEVNLLNSILTTKDYNKLVRPIHKDQPLNITFRINLYQLVEVNEPSQNIIVYVYVTQQWEDEYLGWNPGHFGGLNTTVLPHDKVWIPDTYMYNSVTMENSERLSTVHISTDHSDDRASYMMFQYPGIYTLSCHMDVKYFPFDRQHCNMTFGSWTYDAAHIDYYVQQNISYMEEFIKNEEWNVLDFSFKRELVDYACCANPFVMIKATLVIERKPLFYLINLVVPTLMITIVAIIGFFIPDSTADERAVKVDLGMTTLLAMTIILLMVTDSIPKTSSCVPLLGTFYIVIMVLISAGTIITSLAVVMEKRGRRGLMMPPKVKKLFFGCVAKALYISPPPQLEEFWKRQRVGDAKNSCSTTVLIKTVSDSTDMDGKPTDIKATIKIGKNEESNVIEKREAIVLEWQFLAQILDRICLAVFIVAIFTVTAIMLIVGDGVMKSDRFL